MQDSSANNANGRTAPRRTSGAPKHSIDLGDIPIASSNGTSDSPISGNAQKPASAPSHDIVGKVHHDDPQKPRPRKPSHSNEEDIEGQNSGPLIRTETETREKPIGMGPMAQHVKQRSMFKENPNVFYMNPESLSRPFDIPPDAKKWRWLFVGLAAIIACILLFFYFDYTMNAPQRAQQELQDILASDSKLEMPEMLDLLDLSDAKIKKKLERAAKKGGYTIYDAKKHEEGANDMDLIKIPAGISQEEALVLYAEGKNKMTAVQAAKLLHGAWKLDVNRKTGLNMSLHYADFSSGSLTSAIAEAMAAQNLKRGTNTDSGDDDGFGNAYSSGTIMISGTSYSWSVSSTYLKEVYPISGLPENAVYVGIRIIKHIQ